MKQKYRLADLQLAIMQVLWDRSEASVAEVREALKPDRDLAHTTVGTMLSKMEASKYVTHRSEGRVNLYRPLIKQDDVSETMVNDLADRLFGGDVTEMMCRLLDGADVSVKELAQLKKLIRDKEREIKNAQ